MKILKWIKDFLTGKDYVRPVQLGGSGTCSKCGKYVSNRSFHEARCTDTEEDSDAMLAAALRVAHERVEKRRLQETMRRTQGILEEYEQRMKLKNDTSRSIRG